MSGRCSDKTGKMKFELVKEGALSMDLLECHDVYVVDAKTEIFVWVGHKASKVRAKGPSFLPSFLPSFPLLIPRTVTVCLTHPRVAGIKYNE